MENIKQKIMKLNFAKAFKRWFVASVCTVVVGGAVCGFSMQQQVRDIVSLHNQKENSVSVSEQTAEYAEQGVNTAITNENLHTEKTDREHDGHDAHDDWENRISKPTLTAKILVTFTAAMLCVLAVVYWLLIAAWLTSAAEQAGMNTALWAVFGLAGNLAAVVLFVLIRSRKTQCPVCGRWQDNTSYCRGCGASLHNTCPNCGRTVSLKDHFCPDCGSALNKN